jgi:deazaflavin-dependent oxidoreductase (nitroreductase family)
VVCASNGGAPRNPDWYYNLKAHPNVTIEVGTDTIPVHASEASGEERDRLFTRRSSALHSLANTRSRPAARFR